MTVLVGPGGLGPAERDEPAELKQALLEVLAEPPMPRHLEKLARAEAYERHLFVPLHRSALPFAVADGLWTGTALPPPGAAPAAGRGDAPVAGPVTGQSGAAVDSTRLEVAPAV